MSRVAIRSGVSPSEFFEWERRQSSRHEYWDGEIFDMAGGTPRHAALASRVGRALGTALGRGCETFSSDLQLAFSGDRYVYADVVVICGPPRVKTGTMDVVENPTIVVEVLSKNTEQYDRGGKWEGYRRLPTLEDYLLVSQEAPRIEHFRRAADGSWVYRVAEAGGRVTVSNGAVLEVDAIFDGVFAIPGE